MAWLNYLTLIALLLPSKSIIVYDCGRKRMNLTKISFLSNQNCEIEDTPVQQIKEDIQLLQLSEVAPVHIYQCKINILQTVLHCGMFSHLSIVAGGISTFIADISKENCLIIHSKGIYALQNNRILADIKSNATSRYSEIVAGSVDTNGNCEGVPYSFGSNSWNKVVVMHSLEITITDYDSIVRLDDNQVVLRAVCIVCPYIKGTCTDPESGISFWDMIADASCEDLKYDDLYQGAAIKGQTISRESTVNTIYAVHTGDAVFALEVTKLISVCKFTGYQTEHPRLVIVPKSGQNYWFTKKAVTARNLDLFTFFNSKFVYVERHIKTQMESMYKHIMRRKCELENQVLQTQLAIAQYHPTEFALIRFKEPGFTVVPRGEVLYVIKCQAVEATIRKTDRCYNELPITYDNKSCFMAPTTHLIQEHGTEIPCSFMMKPGYFLHGQWYSLNPEIHHMEEPKSVSTSVDNSWKYEDPSHLIKSGIYTFEETEDLRRQIMFPSERHAIGNVMTQSVMGHDTDTRNLDIMNLLSSSHVSKISSYIQSTWSGLSYFGSFTASIFGILVIVRIVKFCISTVINVQIIRSIHGWSWNIFAAFLNSLTAFVVHRHHRRSRESIAIPNVVQEETIEELERGPTSHLSPRAESEITLQTLRNNVNLYPQSNN